MSNEAIKEQLNDDFRAVLADADALVKATANLGGEKLTEIRTRAEESLRVVRVRMADAKAALRVKARSAVKATDAYVHDNTWEAMGVAGGIGLVIGVLIARR
jgi:ElaB/YqjD/DUF883 family membrane-anchored ribosome-binding protein